MEIKEQTARKLYPEVPDWFKKQLSDEFGDKLLKGKDFESISTPEDACTRLGIKLKDVYHEKDTPDEIAYKILKVVVKAVNGKWTPDWDNTSQQKWFPVFNLSSGFGFSYSYYFGASTDTGVGSRLCFESEEKSDYVAQQFINLYKDLLTITK